MLIHLSSHHNLAVVLYSLQSTPVIAFCVCGTLNGTIFAASIIFVHNFGVKKKKTTKHTGLRRYNYRNQGWILFLLGDACTKHNCKIQHPKEITLDNISQMWKIIKFTYFLFDTELIQVSGFFFLYSSEIWIFYYNSNLK